MSFPAQGDVMWAESPNEKRRPVLIVTRDAAIPVLTSVLVAPVTRTVRGIPTEIPLGVAEGLPEECAATFDNLRPIRKSFLVERAGALAVARRSEICAAFGALADC